MRLTAYIEKVRKTLDEMADEHPVDRIAWLPYSDLLAAIDNFEHAVNQAIALAQENQNDVDS